MHNSLVRLELSECQLQKDSEESEENNESNKDIEPIDNDESNENDDKNTQEPSWLLRLECDTRSLDLTYGLLQLEMAMMLLGEIELTDAEQNDFTEKNNRVFSLIKEKWQNMSTEEKSARTMQLKAVQKVEPCREALENWWNWGIL